MNPVDTKARTTLLLNRNYQAFALITARAAIRHLMNGKARGFDAMGNLASFTGADVNLEGVNSLRWFNNEVSLYEDHPCLRSAPDPVIGIAKPWAIPTILLCNYQFGLPQRTGESVSLMTLFRAYKATCQYCFDKIPYREATKDHCIPKSLGGTNHDFNVVLACRKCNNEKDSKYPYLNADGKEVKPLKLNTYHQIIPDGVPVREEWKPFLPHLQ